MSLNGLKDIGQEYRVKFYPKSGGIGSHRQFSLIMPPNYHELSRTIYNSAPTHMNISPTTEDTQLFAVGKAAKLDWAVKQAMSYQTWTYIICIYSRNENC